MKGQRLAGRLATYGFRKVYDSIDQYGIRKGVDEMGLDGFIKHCARLAASTGAITGMGGAASMIVGIPIDLFNNLTQQFRVTMAVIYDRRGSYSLSFEEFMTIVAVSLGIEAGMIATRTALENIAEKLLTRMGASAGGRFIPVMGAVVGGTTNYLFIKGIGASVKRSLPH
jgi:Na+-transporting NADH:ubiquinone oxidoreductase subunit NqrE